MLRYFVPFPSTYSCTALWDLEATVSAAMAIHSENSAEVSGFEECPCESKKQEQESDDAPKSKVDPGAEGKDLEKKDSLPCPEEQAIKTEYGKLKPKRPPLISMDHEHAFFDSADWALGKQGSQKNKGPLEALRPKLQPSPHHHVRAGRSTYACEADDHEGGHEDSNESYKLSDEEGKIGHECSNNVHPIDPSQET